MLFSLLILGSLLFIPIGFKLKNQVDLYQKANHNLSDILRDRSSINKAVEILPAYYIKELISDNSQLARDTEDVITYLEKSNFLTFNKLSRSKGEKLIDWLITLGDRYSSLELKILRLKVEYQHLRDWSSSNPPVPSGTSRLAWMHGECNWSYFKSCPNILSEIEYTTNQLSKYAEGNDIDKAIILLHRLEGLQQIRDTNIRKTNADREEIENLSKRYLAKVNLLYDLRSQLDHLDLSHLIDTDPNIAGSINELYSLMNIGIHDDWTRYYYQGDYGWFDEMVKGEILINKAVTMYKDLEKRCKETKGASLGTLKS